MSTESTKIRGTAGRVVEWVAPTGGLASGQVVAMDDGRAGIYLGLNAALVGDTVAMAVEGVYGVALAASTVILEGSYVEWDESAGTATFEGNGDYTIGTAVKDAASGDAQVQVDLNAVQRPTINMVDSGFDSVLVGDATATLQAAKLTLALLATSEAEKTDALSEESIVDGSGFIFEALVDVSTDLSGAAVDFNIGMANATHATDADSITESLFFHYDGGDDNIDVESDDGTTEVAAADSTVDKTVGTYDFLQFDARDLADIKAYINGARVVSGSTFKLDAGTGPLKVLGHLEKTTGTTVGTVQVKRARARLTN